MSMTKYLALPGEMTPFERNYLQRLNKVALIFFYLHIPALMAVAWVAGTGALKALVLTLFVMIGPTIAYRAIKHPRALSVVYGITAMLMGGLLVHFGQGPVQIEMHFYFFALLAMLCMFANPMVNIAAAVTVALHHLIVWLILPTSVFNYDAQWWVVLVHAVFVILETIAACYISREFFDNVIGLEKIVQARTVTIREKQRDMRLILDNVETGLVTIGVDGRLSGESSLVVQRWFGAPVAGQTMAAWLAPHDSTYSDWLELALEALHDGALPPEVALGQLPRVMKAGDRTYTVGYQLIRDADGAAGAAAGTILVIFTDITERLRSEAAQRYQGDLLRLFEHIMRDKLGFIEFLTEADEIVRALKSGAMDLDQTKRLVHTLKGNAAIFGIEGLSGICHDLESRMAEEGAAPAAQMAALHTAWERIRNDLGNMLGENRQHTIEIDDTDHKAIITAVSNGVDRQTLVRTIESWRLEPAPKRLARVGQQIRAIGERLGKSHFSVELEAHGLRLSSERFAPFWSAFIHVLRNAVDHGIEDREVRLAMGKSEQARITVSTAVDNDRFIVTIQDDGPGVDWEALRRKATELGIDAAAIAQKENLVFIPGVSSKKKITEFSGRGVGMAAVRNACEALGGTVELRSEQSRGTRVSFVFPKDQTVHEGHASALRGRELDAAA